MAVTWSSRSVSGGEFGGGSHHGIADGVPGHTQYVSDPGEAEAVNNDHLHCQRYCVFPCLGCCRADVVAPDLRTSGTAVTQHHYLKYGGFPPMGGMYQPAQHRVMAGSRLGAARTRPR